MTEKREKLQLKRPVTKVLSRVSAKNREVLARRFGIGFNNPETLESIGKRHGITRERVRQIQEFGLNKLSAPAQEILQPTFLKVEEWIRGKGGVVGRKDLFEGLARPSEHPHFSFVLRLMPAMYRAEETEDLVARYATSDDLLKNADESVLQLHGELEKRKTPLAFAELLLMAKAACAPPVGGLRSGVAENGNTVEYLLALSKRIRKGPFGEFGLAEWPQICPRGIRDKAHLVFEREKNPLHFTDLTRLIDVYFKGGKNGATKANAQTVHNELIKDPRFVLIGRGLYGLANWGYNPGTVKDVLVQILKEGGRPMEKDEIFAVIAERRFVKENTVLLNLQNKHYFRKLEGGKYYLA